MQRKRKPRVLSDEHLQLGLAVRRLRRRLDLSQEAFGLQIGLHRNYVGAVERGEVNPTFRTLLRVAAGLRVNVSTLFKVYEACLGRSRADGVSSGSPSQDRAAKE
jgi:transcriptional regulator with XRE-family HTH domain